MGRKTGYQATWSSEYSWIQPVKEDENSAHCILCKSNFSVGNRGHSQVVSHSSTIKHKKLEDESKQNALLFGKKNKGGQSLLCLSSAPPKKELAHEDLVIQAECLQVLHIIDANITFQSADGDSKRFAMQFPDSRIARDYHQARTKVAYVLQHGIAPVLQRKVEQEISGKPFSFKFDETTTAQVKKQYDGYVTYYCEKKGIVVTSYCGSLFVGHCSAKELLADINHFFDSMKLDRDLFLAVGRDGPKVNDLLENYLLTDLESRGHSRFLSLDSCTLHISNNAFSIIFSLTSCTN